MRFAWAIVALELFSASLVLAQSTSPAPTFASLSQEAQTARDSHQLEKAIDLYRKALKLKPAWDEGLWSLGSIEYDVEHYKDCALVFGRLAELKPDAAPGWTMAGLCEFERRNYGSALDDLARVETLGFSEPPELAREARLHYALALTKSGSFEKAIAVLTDLVRFDKKTPEIIAAAGVAGLRKPWVPAEVPESDREIIYRLGDAMADAMERDYKEANHKFEELLEAYPSEPNIHFRYGALLYIQDADRGIEEIKKAIALAPDHVPALVSLSAISLKREDSKAAVDYGQRAVKANPQDFATHIVLGRALIASDDPARAAAELQEAVKLAPNDPDAHFSLATAYSRLGKKEDAAREQTEFKRLQHLGGK